MTDGIQLFIEYIGIYLFRFGAIKVTRKLSSAMPVRATYVRRILLASTALYHVRPWVVRSWSLKTVLADRAAFTLLSRGAYLYIIFFSFFFSFFLFFLYNMSSALLYFGAIVTVRPSLVERWLTSSARTGVQHVPAI